MMTTLTSTGDYIGLEVVLGAREIRRLPESQSSYPADGITVAVYSIMEIGITLGCLESIFARSFDDVKVKKILSLHTNLGNTCESLSKKLGCEYENCSRWGSNVGKGYHANRWNDMLDASNVSIVVAKSDKKDHYVSELETRFHPYVLILY